MTPVDIVLVMGWLLVIVACIPPFAALAYGFYSVEIKGEK